MQNNKKENSFSYTYSSQNREEISKIRNKYMPPEDTEDKLEKLRRLDKSVTERATVLSLILGIVGTLFLGIGMSLIMSTFGDALGFAAIPIGIVSGLVGIALAAAAYPVYLRVVKKDKERLAPEILKLTEELLK